MSRLQNASVRCIWSKAECLSSSCGWLVGSGQSIGAGGVSRVIDSSRGGVVVVCFVGGGVVLGVFLVTVGGPVFWVSSVILVLLRV